MKRIRAICLLVPSLFIFSKFSICQVPDFSTVPNLNNGDSLSIISLINDGVEIKKGKVICWFPKDSLSVKRMKEIADTISIGVSAAEKFIHAPLPWQHHPATMPLTFYFRTDTIISHASLAGFLSISFWRIKEGKAPWLHEAMHEILHNKDSSWFQKGLSEEYAIRTMPQWLSEGLPDYLAMKVSQINKLPWFDVFSASINPNVDSAFIQNMKSDKGEYIISYIGTKGIMPELFSKDRRLYAPGFYHGSCSFVQFLAGRYGLEFLLNAISSFQKEHEVIETKTGKSIAELKKDWLTHLKIKE